MVEQKSDHPFPTGLLRSRTYLSLDRIVIRPGRTLGLESERGALLGNAGRELGAGEARAGVLPEAGAGRAIRRRRGTARTVIGSVIHLLAITIGVEPNRYL